MKREEVIELVQKIIDANNKTEEEISELLSMFEKNVPHPEPSNLIYWNEDELTPEQIVDKALSYKPIQL